MTPTATRALARFWAILVLAAWGILGMSVIPAHAAAEVASYVVDGDIAADGVLSVNATITPSGSPAELQQRFATTFDSGRDLQYRFHLSDMSVTVGGRQVDARVSTEGAYQVVTVPLSGDAPVVLSYKVSGAALANEDDTTTVGWRLLQGLNLPVRSFDATIGVPGLFTMIDCRAGSPSAPGVCANFTGGTHEQQDPVFHDGPRGAGEIVQIVVRFPAETVKANQDVRRLWTLDNAFSHAPVPLGAALAAGLLGALAFWLLHRRFGRDGGPQADPIMVGGFRPVGEGRSEFRVDADIRPGQVGTLVDERVDPVDITASILDLAVRNHLLITELPRESAFKTAEWTLTRADGVDELHPFERTLLDAIAPADGRPKPLSEATRDVAAASSRIQEELYEDVVRHGWFAVRPDSTRTKWARLGWGVLAAALVAAVLLIAFTQFGLLALVLVALAAGVGFVGQAMPARTTKGSGVLQGLGVLRGQLLTQPTAEMPRGREYEELSQVLPYAVVLGGVDRWLNGLAAADDDDTEDSRALNWYHGPPGWQLQDLPDSLRHFVRVAQGELFTR